MIDDYSRYFPVYFLKSKDIVFEKIEEFVKEVENEILWTLRSERGGEFCRKAMKRYLKSKSIVHQISAPYTREQNCVVERKKE